MVKNNNYFYLSGFISFGLFFSFLAIFVMMMLKSDKIEQFALNKDNFISITLDMPIKKKAKKQVTQITQEITQPMESQEINVDDLFSDVWTKDVKIKKEKPKKIDIKRLQEINKRIKTSQKNKVKQVKEEKEVATKSNAIVVNEYLAKIQLTVYESFYPPQNSQGHTVKAVIELSAIGKVMDFRILTYSENLALNNEVDKIKTRLTRVVFPINPDNKSGIYIINLTSKE